MRNVRRTIVVAAALAGLCLLLLPVAQSAPAAPAFESYQASGVATGVRFSFTFANSIFERLIDLALPYATSDIRSEVGGQERAEAAQVYPGDLVAGSVGENTETIPGTPLILFPGYTIASAPKNDGTQEDTETEQPVEWPFPDTVPLRADLGRNVVVAKPTESSSVATLADIRIGPDAGPHLQIGSMRSETRGQLSADKTSQFTQSEVKNLTLFVTPDVTIRIASIISEVRTSSDGEVGTIDGSAFTVSGVNVVMSGQTFDATIDDQGIHMQGFPSQVPGVTPLSLNRKLEGTLDEQGLRIFTGTSTPLVEGALANASVPGLVIQFTGTLPVVPVPPVAAMVLGQIQEALITALPDNVRPQVRDLLERPQCVGPDIIPKIPKAIIESLPEDLVNGIEPLYALCLGREAIPGPGSGGITTVTIASVQGVAVAGIAPPLFENGGGTTGDLFGTTGGGFTGGFTTGETTGTFGGSTTGGGTGQAPKQLFGRVARLPSGALAGAGAGLLFLAILFAFGPSLRPWRETT